MSPNKKRKFFAFPSLKKSTTSREDDSFIKEIDQYIELDYNTELEVGAFWNLKSNQFPGLRQMAMKFLSAPASSGPVERLFSFAGYINRPHRSKMTEQHLEESTFLRTNISFLNLNIND